ncbi:SH3 domain-containing protein [Streptomyces niveiscabiei]|uniref:SH3 domain-containing protein n=1 Tax=Streptomyces niveiscabiei TaxID=164115 RepID=A0ABW9I727_9ACTN
MGNKVLRSVAMAGVLAAGIGLVGASAASAMPDTRAHVVGPAATYYTTDATVRTVTVDGLRVRMGPGKGSNILGLVYEGESVQVLSTARDGRGQRWRLVMLQQDSAGGLPGGYVGWVSDEYLY